MPKHPFQTVLLTALSLLWGVVACSDIAMKDRQPLAQHPVVGPVPDLGPGASLHGKPVFSSDSEWNRDISGDIVDPGSATLLSGCMPAAPSAGQQHLHADFGTTYNGAPNGIPYIVVSGAQPKVSVTFTAYGDESDPGPYPVPREAPIEGVGPANASGDRHVLVVDRDNWKAYELGNAFPQPDGSWLASGGAIFDLASNGVTRTPGFTSADAAGLSVFAGLVRYDEVVELGAITHALRFTCQRSRHGYVLPALHYASSNTSTSLPPMGMRVRLRADFDISHFSPEAQVILKALKRFGMILADNGSPWFISGAPDERWNTDSLAELSQVGYDNLEVIQMPAVCTTSNGVGAGCTP